MPKYLVCSTEYVVTLNPKILGYVEDMMFEISAKNGFCEIIIGSEEKTSDLAAHFSRNSGTANAVLFTIQTINEHLRMAKLSQPYLRCHMQ